MRVTRIQLKNIANIPLLDLDLESYGEGVIALVGSNGSGKTTLMESMMTTPLFREWVSSPKSGAKSAKEGEAFIDHCWRGDAELKSHITHRGSRFILTLIASPTINKQEAYFEMDGVELNPEGKLTGYDALVKKYFPTKDIILSAPFASQNNIGSFFALDKDARRALFARLLGVEEYDILAQEALALAKQQAGEIAEQERQHEISTVFVRDNAELRAVITGVRETLTDRRAELRAVQGELGELRNHQQKNADTYEAVRAILQYVPDTFVYQPYLIEQLPRWNQLHEESRSRLRGLSDRIDTIRAYRDSLHEEVSKASLRVGQVHADIDRLHESMRSRLYGIQQQQVSYSRNTQALSGVDLSLAICRRCPLTVHAKYTNIANDLLATISGLEERIFDYANTRLEYIKSDALSYVNALVSSVSQVTYTLDALKRDAEYESEWFSWLERRIAEATDYSRRLDQHNAYLQSGAERSWVMEAFVAWYENLRAVLGELEPREQLLVREIDFQVKRLRDLEPTLALLDEHAANIQALEAPLREQRDAVKGLTELADVLSYMKMARIENARPAVEDIANRLLSVYEHGRFRLVLKTSSTRRGSTKEKEDFIPIIFDTKDGVYKKRGSGGQQAMFDEALRLAICIENIRHHHITFETLVRDETTAHVTRDFAADYVKMLRKAQEEGGFYQVIFVTHHESVWPQADNVIEMSHGKILS